MRYCLIARADIDVCIHEVDKQAKCMPVVTTLQIYIFFCVILLARLVFIEHIQRTFFICIYKKDKCLCFTEKKSI